MADNCLVSMVSTAAGSIAARYKLLKGFYGGAISVRALSLMALFFAFFALFFTGSLTYSLVCFAVFLVFTVFLNRLTEKIFLSKCPNYTARRLDSLSVVEMTIVIVGVALSALFSLFSSSAAAVLASVLTTVVVFIGYSVRRAIGLGLSIPVAAILSTPAAVINVFTIHTYLNNFLKALQFSISSYFVGVAAMEAVRYLIDISKPVQALKPFKLLQAFLTSLLSGHSRELEKMMTALGSAEDVGVELFMIKREGKPSVAFVVSEIHPGPFRAVGSSMFPAIVQQKLGNKGIHAVVLKGLSSHEKNLASVELSEKVAEKIAEEAEMLETSPNYVKIFRPPARTKFNGVSGFSFEMAGRNIVVLTLHPQPMEDLPQEILPSGQRDRVVVVDAHNSFDDALTHLEQETIAKIRKYLEEFKEEAVETNLLKIGFARIVPSEVGLAEGMGVGGVSCLVFEADEVRTSLLVADANNAMPWVRTAAFESARKHGCVDTEFCTTDTHMVNGVSLGGRGYHPFGEAIPEQTIRNLFDELHRKAVEDLAPAHAIHKTITVKEVKVFSDFLETVSKAVSFGIKTYGVAGVMGFMASTAITLFLI